jgi:hypothetical protein
MKRTAGVRDFVRIGVLFLLGPGVAGCGTGGATTPGASASATPVVSASISATVSPSASITPVPTAGWVSFSSASGKLSFRYDPAWKPTECPSHASPLIVFAPSICGQIEPLLGIDSTPSAQPPTAADLRCDLSQPRATSSNVLIDGVTGTREYIDYSASAYQDCRHPIEHALDYSFYTSGRAYDIMYLYIPSEGPDRTSAVDEMVQTLRFSA